MGGRRTAAGPAPAPPPLSASPGVQKRKGSLSAPGASLLTSPALHCSPQGAVAMRQEPTGSSPDRADGFATVPNPSGGAALGVAGSADATCVEADGSAGDPKAFGASALAVGVPADEAPGYPRIGPRAECIGRCSRRIGHRGEFIGRLGERMREARISRFPQGEESSLPERTNWVTRNVTQSVSCSHWGCGPYGCGPAHGFDVVNVPQPVPVTQRVPVQRRRCD